MNDVTQILRRIERGETGAASQLLPLVYDELRKLARLRLDQERSGQTLQATALVHEAYLRLVDTEQAQQFSSRGHFFAAAAEAMRRILVEAARRKGRVKHGGEMNRQELDEVAIIVPQLHEDLVALDEALNKLKEVDPQAVELVHLRYFVGLTSPQAAEMLGISERTAERVWATVSAGRCEARQTDRGGTGGCTRSEFDPSRHQAGQHSARRGHQRACEDHRLRPGSYDRRCKHDSKRHDCGTPLYMAPEQARGETLDHRTDLFSLGSVLYQVVSGCPPFRAANTLAVLKRVCEDTPRAIQEVIPETPAWLSAIILRLLEKNRDDRYQTAREVAAVLEKCQTELAANGFVTSVSTESLPQHSSGSRTGTEVDNTDVLRLRGVMWGIGITLIAVVFVLVASPRIARWFDTPIPTLAPTDSTAGLRFDGKDDFVRVEGLNWDFPQFTLECYVTSVAGSDNGTIAVLSGEGGSDAEWMLLFDGGPADPGKRISGAGIKGATNYESAYGPFRAGERQHRALVYDVQALHYYINGVWQGKRSAQPYEGLQWKMRTLQIGSGDDGRRFFQGTIDQLRVSRVARYSDRFIPEPQLQTDKQTLALYHFDAGGGDILKTRPATAMTGRSSEPPGCGRKGSRPANLQSYHRCAVSPTDVPGIAVHQESQSRVDTEG